MSGEAGTVCVIGLGYVGLPTAAVIANRGIEVVGVDTDDNVVEELGRGETHIVEPDLDILVRSAIASGNLTIRAKPVEADVFVIAVPTPFTDRRTANLEHLETAARDLAPVLKSGDLVVLESTSPVGTTGQLATWLAEARADLSFPVDGGETCDVHVAHSPERVLPGRVLLEVVDNERVIGGLTPACGERAKTFYATFVKGDCHVTDARTAELVKLAENAYRDTNIAFANEMANVCEELGIDVWSLVELANRHPRVNILRPGPGVGGHCIAVDPWFIVQTAPDSTPLIKTARDVNDGMPARVVRRIKAALGEQPGGPVACLGLAYKADIDDLRESPALDVIRLLAAETSVPMLIVEPNIESLPGDLALRDATFCALDDALDAADIVVLLTDHNEFRSLERERLAGKTVIDTRGIWR